MCDLISADIFNKYRYFLANILKRLTNDIQKPSSTFTIGKNRTKMRQPTERQTNAAEELVRSYVVIYIR